MGIYVASEDDGCHDIDPRNIALFPVVFPQA